MLKKLLSKLETWLESAQSMSLESIYPNLEIQEKILSKLASETDFNSLLSRSYSQYLAQRSLMPKKQAFFLNLASASFILPYILFCFLCGILKKSTPSSGSEKLAVFFEATNDVVPESLLKKFKIFTRSTGLELFYSDILYVFKIALRYPAHPYFISKITYKMAQYRYNLSKYRPSAILCSSEYSFTSSVLTKWCHDQKITHINIQHGEKLFHIMDSFSSFDEYYIWGHYYEKLAKQLHSSAASFHIEIPESFKKFQTLAPSNFKDNFTYFLQTSDYELWHQISAHLKPLMLSKKIIIRAHPRWFNEKTVSEIFQNYSVENPLKINILKSIEETHSICSAYSTVLFLGSLAKREVIIDDVSNPKLFEILRNLQIGALHRPHKLLSSLNPLKNP
jgi:hypothetical protein